MILWDTSTAVIPWLEEAWMPALEGEEIPLPKQLQRPLVQGDAGVGVHIVSITWEML